MRVAIVSESFYPTVNGVTNSVARIGECLIADGHEVLIIAPYPGPSLFRDIPVVRVPSRDLRWYPSFPIGLTLRGVTDALRDFEPDIIHLASPIALGASAVVAVRRLKLPAVAVFQTDVARFAERYGYGWAAPAIWRWLRWIHNQAELTLAPSTAAADDLAAWGVEPIRLWGRGVDVRLFHPAKRSTSLRRLWAPNGELIVGYVGRLAAEKEVHHLRHLAGLDGVRLIVVGGGPAEQQLRRALPGAWFTGFLSGEPLADAYASFDVFVHTGRADTFGQTVQEALASGVPALVPAAGGPRDLVEHWINGWRWNPENPGEIREVVRRVSSARTSLPRLRLRARASVERSTWPYLTDQLINHYLDAIALAAREEAQ